MVSEKAEQASKADPNETRQRILDAAADLFAVKGFAGATTRELAAAAGVNEVTLFRHFGSKKNLLAAVIDQHSALPDLAAVMNGQLTGDYRQDLLHLGGVFLTAMTERREAVRLMLCEAEQLSELREVAAQIPVQLRQMLAGYLRRQMEAGRVRESDPEIMAQAFFGMFFAHSLSQVMLARPVAPELPAEELVAQFVDIFVRGTISQE